MKAVFFCHAFTSCWNNGNAHFLRGVTRELARLGHQVLVCEPGQGWSRSNALRDGGEASLQAYKCIDTIRGPILITFCLRPILLSFMNGIHLRWWPR